MIDLIYENHGFERVRGMLTSIGRGYSGNGVRSKLLFLNSITRTLAISSITSTLSSSQIIDLELKKSAHNYHPIPVVLKRGQGVHVWDVEDKVRHAYVIQGRLMFTCLLGIY